MPKAADRLSYEVWTQQGHMAAVRAPSLAADRCLAQSPDPPETAWICDRRHRGAQAEQSAIRDLVFTQIENR